MQREPSNTLRSAATSVRRHWSGTRSLAIAVAFVATASVTLVAGAQTTDDVPPVQLSVSAVLDFVHDQTNSGYGVSAGYALAPQLVIGVEYRTLGFALGSACDGYACVPDYREVGPFIELAAASGHVRGYVRALPALFFSDRFDQSGYGRTPEAGGTYVALHGEIGGELTWTHFAFGPLLTATATSSPRGWMSGVGARASVMF